MPIRVQLRRVAGWRIPPNTVSVGRSSKYGNPYWVGTKNMGYECASSKEAVEKFRALVESDSRLLRFRLHDLELLRGKNLACWCKPDSPCHADVLLELANR